MERPEKFCQENDQMMKEQKGNTVKAELRWPVILCPPSCYAGNNFFLQNLIKYWSGFALKPFQKYKVLHYGKSMKCLIPSGGLLIKVLDVLNALHTLILPCPVV